MIFKKGIVALALWTLLLGPTLCGLGVLVHACLGDRDTECHDEVQCSSDPCQLLILPAAGHHGKLGNGIVGDGIDHLDHAPLLVLDSGAPMDRPLICLTPCSELAAVLPTTLACIQNLPLLC